jgi:protein TonB
MRILILIAAALAINTGLFLLMESMISREAARLSDIGDPQVIDFIQPRFDEELRTRDRRTLPPPRPQEIERPRAQVENIANRASDLPTNVAAFQITSLLGEGGGVVLGETLVAGDFSSMDLNIVMAEDLIPLTMLPPQYPTAARLRGLEGWVEVLFVVNEEGAVEAPEILASEPPRIFDQAALDAAGRWRFRPVSEDGEPVAVLAQIRINFSLDQ